MEKIMDLFSALISAQKLRPPLRIHKAHTFYQGKKLKKFGELKKLVIDKVGKIKLCTAALLLSPENTYEHI